jgi:multiple sugar transport system substrate-binding protein
MASQEPAPSALPAGGASRRTVLKGIGVGAAGIAAAPLLAACTGTSKSSSSGGDSASKATTLGSSASDAVPKRAVQAMADAFNKKSGDTVKINTVPHNDFQENINNYLQGSPDETFTWFAGYRMRYYAKKGLAEPIDDVWDKIGGNFSDALAKASTGDDGKKYFVPNYNYPWAVFYRKSVWTAKGYTAPKTFDEFKALCTQMKKDGLTPIAFGEKDGWPAMGTFDYLNMRLNGYQFHIDLMGHKESWDSDKVRNVFDQWKSILPFHAAGSLGRTWVDAATTVVQKKSGMYLLGSFVAQQWVGDAKDDIDFFAFPELDPANAQDAVEAPIDGFMLSKKGKGSAAAKAWLEFIGTGAGQDAYAAVDSSNVATAKDANHSKFSALQKKSQETIANAKYISQFLDRDSLPAFASNVMIPALQNFVKTGSFDTKTVEAQAKSLFDAQG